ncbi:MAG: hypothetical protein A3K60_08940 [Euryarchaeota archaeon RBG_19FT_COMBO_56_21]|nr:MAG: hypothetical protein A3K60_08940 [Euryarchaeota archaeon RBG_19FT_COMBO_56_21]
MAVSFIPLVGPILACVVDGTFVDMINALKNGDWAMLGMCALGFVPGMKQAKMGLKAVGSFSGKGQKFIRYMGEKEYKSVLKTKTVQSMSGRTYMTKNTFRDSDTMLSRLNKPNPSDRCFVEFKVKNEVQIHGPSRVASNTGGSTGAWEYWIEEGDSLSIDILSHGRLP